MNVLRKFAIIIVSALAVAGLLYLFDNSVFSPILAGEPTVASFLPEVTRPTADKIEPSASRVFPPKQLNLPILMYHHVASPPPNDPNWNSYIEPSRFEEQLLYLKNNGYETITLSEMNRYFLGSFSLPKKPIILTFDDAYTDFYTNVFPLLEKYKVKSNLAVITGLIGGEHMTWAQLKEVASKGVEIANHTRSHFDLATASAEQVREDLSAAQNELDAQLGKASRFLVFPSGKYTEETISIAKELGFLGALTTDYGFEISTQYYYEIPRIRISRDTHLSEVLP
jgi:peptidoglycan/xylan/chitin deacetylase (PgdA/CDA1 family)